MFCSNKNHTLFLITDHVGGGGDRFFVWGGGGGGYARWGHIAQTPGRHTSPDLICPADHTRG